MALDAYLMPVEDGIETSVEQPLLFINSWTFQWPDNVAKIKSLLDGSSDHTDSECYSIDCVVDRYCTVEYSHRQLITLRYVVVCIY